MIVISCGEPFGISYQVLIKALARWKRYNNMILVGDFKIWEYFVNKLGVKLKINLYRYIDNISAIPAFIDINYCNQFYNSIKRYIGKKTLKGAKIALDSLKTSLKVMEKFKDSLLITMPVCKETIMKVESSFIGHTEFLARKYNVKSNVFQAYISGKFFYCILTSHIPLSRVSDYITYENLYNAVHKIYKTCGIFINKMKFGILCVNPHCGEFLKTKEEDKIKKIIQKLRTNGIDIKGPFSFEHSIKLFERKDINVCIGIYHDQVITPLKILTKNKLLELNIGIPIYRIGPVHGVGFDIARAFNADDTSTLFTLRFASSLIQKFRYSNLK